MEMKTLFVEQAEANRFINRQWLDALAPLSQAELDRPQGAFFDSIFGAWNHILLGDRLWMERIRGEPNSITNLRHRLTATLEDLRRERALTDDELARIVGAESDFSRELAYRNNRGLPFRTPLYQVLAHLFAHQAHHRGQIHQMCCERKIALPDGGLIEYYRGLRA
jgi:uncharacterized damage-inducible protein DinB